MTVKRIVVICNFFNLENYLVNQDLPLDFSGDVTLSNRNLTKFNLNFNRVDGDFDCCSNLLTSLIGSPKFVGGNFKCLFNPCLNSIEGLGQVEGEVKMDGHLMNTFDYKSYKRLNIIMQILK